MNRVKCLNFLTENDSGAGKEEAFSRERDRRRGPSRRSEGPAASAPPPASRSTPCLARPRSRPPLRCPPLTSLVPHQGTGRKPLALRWEDGGGKAPDTRAKATAPH